MQKRTEFGFMLLLIMGAAIGAEGQRTPTPGAAKSNAPARSAVRSTHTLSFETGVVLKSGDVKPIARADFQLLDRDLTDILDAAGYPRTLIPSAVFVFWRDRISRDLKFERPQHIALFQAAIEAIHAHSLASTVTDFSGKGQFKMTAGTYYVYGSAEIGRGVIVWSVKVDLTSDQAVTLDNRNASDIISEEMLR